MPPYILYKAKSDKFVYEWMKGGPLGAIYNTTPSGWMETDQFHEWLKTFTHYVRNVLRLSGPIVLFLDGHLSHVSIKVIDHGIEQNVHIVCIPPHSSHVWQPLDVSVYSVVKKCWRVIVRDFNKRTGCENLSKFHFASLMKILHEQAFLPEHAVSGFRKTGY